MFEIVLGLVIAVCLLNLFFQKGSGPPVVPYLVPFLGHTAILQRRAAEFLNECREKYGSVFTIHYLGERVVVFSGSEAREMMKIPDLIVKEPRDRIMSFSDAIGEWKGAQGYPEHRILTEAVVKSNVTSLLKDILPSLLTRIDRVVLEQLGDIRKPIVIDAHIFVSEIVVSTVALLLVGQPLSENKELKTIMKNYYSQIEAIITLGLKWKLFPFVGNQIAQFLIRAKTPSIRIRQEIKNIITSSYIIRKAQVDPPPATNVMDNLIDEGHDLDTVAHLVMALTFAAVSTTSNACISLLADLLAFPEFINRLKLEQKQVLKDAQVIDGRPVVTKEHLEKMEHLDSAIRETLRHRAHRVELWRSPSKPHTLKNGMHLTQGSLMAVDCTSLHFDEQEYPSPFEYRPFRFVGLGLNATRVNGTFTGFGSGKHACPGRFFAVQEITAIMSILLRECDFSTLDGKPGPFVTNTIFPKNYRAVLSANTYLA
ncbi:hypothetical protein DSO57_1033066 [Entomophthora muscae]|uniref:Uncharacterized protein n=1 Tax=Entomophthora muscae TaxID=34485 RepID=A0ACC2TBA9_9FUNG|nr:hypothetical protein DSO57_1033066 [Entomophthora muscae]